ncbi:Scr1 family TA system antitoxin-like transcriptional regulator [Streptomyces cinereoruber]
MGEPEHRQRHRARPSTGPPRSCTPRRKSGASPACRFPPPSRPLRTRPSCPSTGCSTSTPGWSRRSRPVAGEGARRWTLVLDEAVLQRTWGNAQVMAGQLDHLLRLDNLPHVTIRVLLLDSPMAMPFAALPEPPPGLPALPALQNIAHTAADHARRILDGIPLPTTPLADAVHIADTTSLTDPTPPTASTSTSANGANCSPSTAPTAAPPETPHQTRTRPGHAPAGSDPRPETTPDRVTVSSPRRPGTHRRRHLLRTAHSLYATRRSGSI